jgi:DNA-binding SARP family transcriptional activator
MHEFRVLGPLEVLAGDRPVRLGGRKQRAALAILLLSANRVVSVERLADDLYAGAPPVTAVTQVQRQVSELRKLLGAEAIETRSPGYLIRVESGALDLERFERLTGDAGEALERGDAERAAALFREALELWRGAPLADLAYESFAQTAIARLEELRLTALEQLFEAELACGRDAQLVPELEALVWDHPLRERVRGLLMLALYRSGRQADALDEYRRAREALVEGLGIEPSPALRELERRMLAQDPALARDGAAPADAERTTLAVPSSDDAVPLLAAAAAPLQRLSGRTLLVARLVADEQALAAAAAAVNARSGGAVRTAAFTSPEPTRDLIRLAETYDVELLLLDAAWAERDLDVVAQRSPADVAVLFGGAPTWAAGASLFVPFGGSGNDWAALELGAWLASSAGASLTLVGTTGDPARGRRDASRLLADASIAVQRVVGVAAAPVLAEPTPDGLAGAVAAATAVVAGLPARWPREGLGVRGVLVAGGAPPTFLVHRGTRPGVLAPRESRTRFSWSLEP